MTTDLARAVFERRRELALGQEDLAELAGVSVRFVRDLEHGKRTARLDKIEAVLAVLGLSMELKVRST